MVLLDMVMDALPKELEVYVTPIGRASYRSNLGRFVSEDDEAGEYTYSRFLDAMASFCKTKRIPVYRFRRDESGQLIAEHAKPLSKHALELLVTYKAGLLEFF